MRELTLIEQSTEAGDVELCSPRVGRFTPGVSVGDLVSAGGVLGTLKIMTSRFALRVPHGVVGRVSAVSADYGVGYGAPLAELTTLGDMAEGTVEGGSGAVSGSAGGGIEISAPIDGIFYSRPSPDDPPFAEAGAEVRLGQTVGLIEVMKTFNPVRLEGGGLPERMVVRAVLAKDQQEVAAGQTILRVDPAP